MTPPPRKDRQPPDLHHQPVLQLAFPILRIIPLRETQLELLHEVAEHQSHLHEREVFPDAVSWAERERNERVRVVHELLVGLLDAFCDQPAFGVVRLGMGEVAWVAVDRPGVDPEGRAGRKVAEGRKASA